VPELSNWWHMGQNLWVQFFFVCFVDLKIAGQIFALVCWKKYIFIMWLTSRYLSYNVVLQWFKEGQPYLVVS
jgi:hypothetical protein